MSAEVNGSVNGNGGAAAGVLVPSRDSIRAAVLGSKQLKRMKVTFFNTELELVQPTLGHVIDDREAEAATSSGIIRQLIKYAHVPGTDVRLFEDSDEEALKELPFGQDIINVTEALSKLMDINFPKPGSNLQTSPSGLVS